MSIKVIVAGFKGRMGSTAVEMVKGDDELTLAALLDPFATEKEVTVFLSSQIKRIWLALTQMSGWISLCQLLPMKIHALLLKMALLQ